MSRQQIGAWVAGVAIYAALAFIARDYLLHILATVVAVILP